MPRPDRNAAIQLEFFKWKYPEIEDKDLKALLEYVKHYELLRKYQKTIVLIDKHRKALLAVEDSATRVDEFMRENPRPDKTFRQYLVETKDAGSLYAVVDELKQAEQNLKQSEKTGGGS